MTQQSYESMGGLNSFHKTRNFNISQKYDGATMGPIAQWGRMALEGTLNRILSTPSPGSILQDIWAIEDSSLPVQGLLPISVHK